MQMLSQEDQDFLNLENSVSEFCARFQQNDPHTTISSIHKLCRSLGDYLQHQPEDVGEILRPAWRLHGASPFIRRLQRWPRGYPGDFETIEWLADATPRIDASDPAYWLEWYALNCPIAQQHRNKLVWQRRIIERAARRGGRIMNLGCGGCADLAGDPPFLEDCDFTLIDMDSDALALSADRLRKARSVASIKQDALRGAREAATLGPFDAIVCGGLFDYLPSRHVSRLLNQLSASVAADGCIAFTNISDSNPYRIWIENLADWKLIHRSEDDIRCIVAKADAPSAKLRIERDASKLALLCTLHF
ncbi:class I SAM-dependent methyltransferase [Methylocystis sp. ATCC 49242]|uniref:class I SAM-dependent methyltransferase n=1 Tax=Methylocystis sp. ATCC 49242 TaxID=622637 RepID=UPI00068559E1|nr:class I SAM-dependent methyltransferase [Methylocystis sp. ATCC 49242]